MIRKFQAASTRDALRQIRDALGADAIILSNRQVPGGVEIMAVADMDMSRLTSGATGSAGEAPVKGGNGHDSANGNGNGAKHAFASRAEVPPPIAVAPAGIPAPPAAPSEMSKAAQPAPGWENVPETGVTAQPQIDLIMRELKALRGMVEGQLAGFAWNELQRRHPERAEIMKLLLAAGFNPQLGHHLIDHMPSGFDADKSMKWLRAALMRNLQVASPNDDIADVGGVYALVGPTGVGKTTTVAKIAARAVLKHGPGNVALITTDSYRIGAQDQLRIYGRILGVPVYAVKDAAELQLTLADLAHKRLTLIDTVGMSQRDKRVDEQLDLLCGDGRPVQRLLLLSMTAQNRTLEDVARAYQGPCLAGCILTKIDESLACGGALDVVIRNKLRVCYLTNGQRVPEDLHLPNALYLVDRALKGAQGEPVFTLRDGDYPLLMATWNQGGGKQVEGQLHV
jgi:flagellar biosynthesis protein FlhF